MSTAMTKRIVVVIGLFTILYWETLSQLGSEGTFNAVLYEADSEAFFMIAPALLIIWIVRHFLPHQIVRTLQANRTEHQDASVR